MLWRSGQTPTPTSHSLHPAAHKREDGEATRLTSMEEGKRKPTHNGIVFSLEKEGKADTVWRNLEDFVLE
jgi:hypothetical protein